MDFITAWGKQGTSKGEFQFVYIVSSDRENNIYVIDSFNRIQKFNSSEVLLRSNLSIPTSTPLSVDATNSTNNQTSMEYLISQTTNNIPNGTNELADHIQNSLQINNITEEIEPTTDSTVNVDELSNDQSRVNTETLYPIGFTVDTPMLLFSNVNRCTCH